jgi:hypothetical protein
MRELNGVQPRLWRILLMTCSTLLLITFLSLSIGCEPFAPIRIQNKTRQLLSIFINDTQIGDVQPGAEVRNKILLLSAGKYNIEAKDIQGNVVYSKQFTYEEMKKINWKVVIPLQ